MTDREQMQRSHNWELLYEKYGKPLESDHSGEFVAISPSGKTLLAPSFGAAVRQATEVFGRGNFIYKVGARSVGTALCVNSLSATAVRTSPCGSPSI